MFYLQEMSSEQTGKNKINVIKSKKKMQMVTSKQDRRQSLTSSRSVARPRRWMGSRGSTNEEEIAKILRSLCFIRCRQNFIETSVAKITLFVYELRWSSVGRVSHDCTTFNSSRSIPRRSRLKNEILLRKNWFGKLFGFKTRLLS